MHFSCGYEATTASSSSGDAVAFSTVLIVTALLLITIWPKFRDLMLFSGRTEAIQNVQTKSQ